LLIPWNRTFIRWAGLVQAMLQVVDSARGKSARRIYLAAFGAGGSMPALHIVTLPGMGPITATASSGSVTPQAIQLTLTVHQK
jgi:hypothetical protein